MKRYIAFLRGINVGGKNKIPMACLKAGFEEMGLAEVKTCLNSGNVIFSRDGHDEENFSGRLESNDKRKIQFGHTDFCHIKRRTGGYIEQRSRLVGR